MSRPIEHRANLGPARAVGGGAPINPSISPPPPATTTVADALLGLGEERLLLADVAALRTVALALVERAKRPAGAEEVPHA